jgi:hypothetical protein
MPDGWRWLNTISFEAHVLKGMAINEMYDLTWTCAPYETIIPELSTCQLVDGHDALNLYDMDTDNEHYKWTLLLYEFVFYGWYRLHITTHTRSLWVTYLLCYIYDSVR